MNIKILTQTYKFIKKESIILVPYLLFFLILQICLTLFPLQFDEKSMLSLNIIIVFI